MDFAAVWDQLTHSVHEMPRSGLLMAALGAMLLGLVGSIVLRPAPLLVVRISRPSMGAGRSTIEPRMPSSIAPSAASSNPERGSA